MSRRHSPCGAAGSGQQGFTLIEVMIAVLVLGVGLLGFAMLQTMNVRYTKSAQDRTVATMLAYQLIDMMRTQRSQASYYNGVTASSFSGVDGTGNACSWIGGSATPAENIARWKCELRRAFPDGTAQVELQPNGTVTVTIDWSDSFWEADPDNQKTTFQVTSRI
ncbi:MULTISPECIES: type IV pilus modification protein PilV [Pseudoxanthomonas]|jgi:type IV pilus assembly protein PilV|uniref:Type IV pilus modification protein PilV n=1 Tax=Pseudoxanthomonas winnipegensis TaxID=2480810 RepID=A0A4V2HDG5_9GAMM|nr:type IV pilus modification protein PilV [Pseudoxanthomonas winnipegensis]RZZ85632.1 type IV pilus modification protein PilV [Pseudoxanthomonas winnipegensis]TAA10812.1 type IV pilus modification protein PilV [Pseudoxanthomonas winnipegensis]TAA22034.1 type IV pilus modification protein PilV [Pseudoxanthomonas winnipegensis]TAA27312.1 type IV pilus modification protein PilV [Pseudoxanthomonas winnipegensis]TAA35879.1 type IV pilus modification protein PilV [Pseudoxanthomonas winnipegensis]